jgi:NADH-quinone oxidoreductase subunit K
MREALLFNTFQQFTWSLSWCDISLLTFIVISFAFLGIIFMHKNLIVIFMCMELVIVAVAFHMVATSLFFAGSFGLVFGYLLLIVAGAESALALAILTAYFFIEQHIHVEFVYRLKG